MSDVKNWNRLDEILYRADDGLTVYVYRVDKRGRRQGSYLLRTHPYPGLLDTLRDQYGGGDFSILIRDGNTMVLSGTFGIEGDRNRPQKWSW